MSHKRTQIRNALVAQLTGMSTCGAHVYGSRLRPLSASEVPAILVSTGAEENESPLLSTGVPLHRKLEVRMDIVVKAVSGYEDTADTVIGEIEGALFDSVDDNTLGGIAESIELASIGDPDMDDSTDKPVVRLPVILRVNYFS